MTNIRTTRINSWQATPGSVLITTHRITDGEPVAGLLEISAVQNHILRVRFTERSAFRNPESLMVMAGEAAGALRVEDGPDALLLATADVQLEIDKNSTAFSWRDANGNPLVREPANPGRRLHEIPVFRTVWDDQAEVATEKTVDGEKVRAAGGKTVQDRLAYSAKVSFEFADGEAIYGLGQHEEGVLNYRGHYQYLYQQNMKVAMPAFVSSRGYGCLFDTTALSIFRDDQQGTYFWTEVVEELDFYFLYGPEFDRIVGGIRDLTGHLPMLPKWAYGYCQSKERYVTQDELLAIAAEYRRRRLPLDCIVQDWCTWPDGQWGYKTFDPSRFPDPGKLMEELHAVNVRLMVSIWPNLTGEQNRDLAEFREAGELLGNQATYNAFLPAARERYWRQANHGYFQHGIDAWWCDCTEPFEADWNGEVKLEPEQRLAANTGESRKYLDPSRINAYSLLHARGIYEGQRRQTDRKRVANLTRSACPGQQRYATVTWSGDVEATWSRLRRQIADGLNFAVTGNPRWTFDIGAFFVKPGKEWFRAGEYPEGCDDLGYRELYTRWFQLGAFLPMFRSHGTDTPREIWRFGEPGTRFYDTLRAFSELRYRLLPYVYSVAARECFDAYTMLRMLAFDFRHDRQCLDVNDQFMFGSALMICPVTQPMYYDAGSHPLADVPRSRTVYLPEGCGWTDFWTGERFAGGQEINAPAPLDIMPIFVRDGAILPMGPVIQYADEDQGLPWEVRVYAGADGAFELYEDAGDGYDYEMGARATFVMRWHDHRKVLQFGERTGSFAGMAGTRTLRLVPVRPGYGVGHAETAAAATIEYRGQSLEIQLA